MPDQSVLAVEDEDAIALTLKVPIGPEGFGLTRLATGAEALPRTPFDTRERTAALRALPAD